MNKSLQRNITRSSRPNYSFYTSDRHPTSRAANSTRRPLSRRLALVVLAVLLIVAGWAAWPRSTKPIDSQKAPAAHGAVATPISKPAVNHCAKNTRSKLALIDISQRHLWACEHGQTVYDSPVITGMAFLAADLTPTGTYKVYAKETDQTLTGSDSTGSWNDYVYYWMPFLENQYGIYGFHDATWRDDSAFGHVSPNSKNASHGCVELPLATAKWLYAWAKVGTTVKIQS
ncbi:MAG TPA: L,D-transpeptidase [Candidatus Saccharimonadales bacterium]|nr:L,D-transpeptidase [Candidatus Saccharimonadales bacterium]